MVDNNPYDVIVVGGGPAGSVAAWSLARQGIRTVVIERSTFPREKVCGDFIDPAGFRIVRAMQCEPILDVSSRLPITFTRIFVQSELVYSGSIPFYVANSGLPPYGVVVPRDELDSHLLNCARAASATVREGCSVTDISRDGRFLLVNVQSKDKQQTLRARLVVGADGTESTVARSFGLLRNDRRYIAISQRGYVDGVSLKRGEATIWFDSDFFPGYAWLFPMPGGRANVGVGILSESCYRFRLSVPKLFRDFLQKLRDRHPGCAKMQLTKPPRGGVVKTYGGIYRNHFDGGVLVGDAGSFADPITGEGITQGMESAIIASRTLAKSVEEGRFDASFLSQYELDFRRYFDPSMNYLQLCASIMRNRNFGHFWLRAGMQAFEEAGTDPIFAKVAGSFFGGVDLQPLAALRQMWSKMIGYVGEGIAGTLTDLVGGTIDTSSGLTGDLAAWRRGWRESLTDGPLWHVDWLADVATKAAALQATLWTSHNPRVIGPIQFSHQMISPLETREKPIHV